MNARRTALHIVLLLLLLCSQQMGLSHAVTHVLHGSGHAAAGAPAAAQERPLPAELQCVKCLAFASIGSGLVDGAPQRVADPETGSHHLKAAATPAVPSPIRAFDSRAPPVSC